MTRAALEVALRTVAAAGAVCALATAHLLWWGHRSDLAAATADWDAAAAARGVAAGTARLVPGSAADLLPDFALSAAARSKVLAGTGIAPADALRAAPYDYRIWRLILGEALSGRRPGAVGAARALTHLGRGLGLTWLEAGDVYLGEGLLDDAVAAYREGVIRLPSRSQAARVTRKLISAGAPLTAIFAAAPATEENRTQQVETILRYGDLLTAVAAAKTAAAEFPGSRRLAGLLGNADHRLKAVNKLREKAR